MTDPLDHLTYDDLPEPLQQVAHYCGMDAVKSILRFMPGWKISVPAVKSIESLSDRYILAEHNGRNVAKIARRLGCSDEFVRARLRKAREEKERKPNKRSPQC